jgi:hypothetical protein
MVVITIANNHPKTPPESAQASVALMNLIRGEVPALNCVLNREQCVTRTEGTALAAATIFCAKGACCAIAVYVATHD